jgi:hypothetical protein
VFEKKEALEIEVDTVVREFVDSIVVVFGGLDSPGNPTDCKELNKKYVFK